MGKNKAVYIGSTPQNVSREAEETELKKLEAKSKEIQNNLKKIKMDKGQFSYT
ncbi:MULTISPECIES: hypothetical protein [Bacillus subtilis group]|uniref:hypothetical protein n=1 Tax=Bacillus TaxID=1386 RepID=UPI0015FE2838|nr:MULTISPECIES: hypothetical protein [Bacillus subtilis group]MBT3123438.1 hypothetical protein [Bacillus inaquosorum]MCB5337078.1 hypothetical protein [Bacillus amyloliquefaciens]MCB5337383.1 hypothetical protein [Bacillus amyloliquefaciens]MCF7615414.1 hypothetical protein [Bacillus subtilis]QTG87337.1 hypothetical protein J4048_20645 [Bacillus amyloliquefaciens]